jgi:hypothetical protein
MFFCPLSFVFCKIPSAAGEERVTKRSNGRVSQLSTYKPAIASFLAMTWF